MFAIDYDAGTATGNIGQWFVRVIAHVAGVHYRKLGFGSDHGKGLQFGFGLSFSLQKATLDKLYHI